MTHGLISEEAAEHLYRVLTQRWKRKETLQHLQIWYRREWRPLHIHLRVDIRLEGWGLTRGDWWLHWESVWWVLSWGALWHGGSSGVTHGTRWSRGRNRRSRGAWRCHSTTLCVLWASTELIGAFTLILGVVGPTEKQCAQFRVNSKRFEVDFIRFSLYDCRLFGYLRPIFCAKSTVGWTLISNREGIFFPEAPSVGLLWPGVGSNPTPGGGFGSGAIPCFLRSSSSNSSSRAFSSSVLIIW